MRESNHVYLYIVHLVGFFLRDIVAFSSPFSVFLIGNVDSLLIFGFLVSHRKKKHDAKKITLDF